MSKLPRIVLGLIAAVVAAPTLADSPQGASGASSAAAQAASPQRVQRVGTRMDIIVVHGAVDPDKKRWTDSGKATPTLPTVSDAAFLEGDGAELVESPADSRP